MALSPRILHLQDVDLVPDEDEEEPEIIHRLHCRGVFPVTAITNMCVRVHLPHCCWFYITENTIIAPGLLKSIVSNDTLFCVDHTGQSSMRKFDARAIFLGKWPDSYKDSGMMYRTRAVTEDGLFNDHLP